MYTTLDDLRSSPLFKVNMVSGVSCDDVRPVLAESRKFYEQNGLYTPEVSALRFYLLNHLVAELETKTHPYEPLNDLSTSLVNDYRTEVQNTGRAVFTYLMLICTREARHAHNEQYFQSLEKSDPILYKFLNNIRGSGSASTVTQLMYGLDKCPLPMSLEEYVSGLVSLFSMGRFSSSYGGKAWATICETLLAFVSGSISLEMLVDQAFHLAHNNGAIFNKGMVFGMYGENLAVILDVQRSGQIPNLCANPKLDGKDNYYLEADTRARVKSLVGKYLTSTGIPSVNWVDVAKLGGKQSYKKYMTSDQLSEIVPDSQGNPTNKKKPTKDNKGTKVNIHAGLFLTTIEIDRLTGTRI